MIGRALGAQQLVAPDLALRELLPHLGLFVVAEPGAHRPGAEGAEHFWPPDAEQVSRSGGSGTLSARATFHSNDIVGTLRPSSIWLSMARLTPAKFASRSRE